METSSTIEPSTTETSTTEILPPIELIVAFTNNGIIGDTTTNKLLWHIPEDLRRFKELTTSHIVVMGRKTYDSLPISPLPNRINVVISRTLEPYISQDLYITNETGIRKTIQDLQTLYPDKRVYIIGGSQIYNMFFNECIKVHVTVISPREEIFNVDETETSLLFHHLGDLQEKYKIIYESKPTISRNTHFIYQYKTYVPHSIESE